GGRCVRDVHHRVHVVWRDPPDHEGVGAGLPDREAAHPGARPADRRPDVGGGGRRMSLLGSLQRRNTTFRDPAEWLVNALGAPPTAAGVRVTSESALGIPSVYAAVGLVSEAVGALPLKVQRVVGTQREDDKAHPAYTLLHDLPN